MLKNNPAPNQPRHETMATTLPASPRRASAGRFPIASGGPVLEMAKMPFTPAKPSLYGEDPASLAEILATWDVPAFRQKQLLKWLYDARVDDFAAMTNLPQSLRERLAETFTLSPLRQVLVKNPDGTTEKLLLELEDRSLIETVLIRYPQQGVGAEESRRTICVSSQVGCAYGCKFCASGLAGWRRNLTRAEIVGQLIEICHWEESRGRGTGTDRVPFDNIVFM
ncbi:MAG: hypothetical protein ACOC3I_06830, partial [Verrucomicrobiota bacterium]